MSYARQAELIASDGIFLLTRSENVFTVDLYEVDDLVVEVFYRKENDEPVSVLASYTNDRLKTLRMGNMQPRLTIKGGTYQQGQHAA